MLVYPTISTIAQKWHLNDTRERSRNLASVFVQLDVLLHYALLLTCIVAAFGSTKEAAECVQIWNGIHDDRERNVFGAKRNTIYRGDTENVGFGFGTWIVVGMTHVIQQRHGCDATVTMEADEHFQFDVKTNMKFGENFVQNEVVCF